MRVDTRTRKRLIAGVVGVAAAVAVAAPAMATRENVGGGIWVYGVNVGVNDSEYFHPNNYHRSSVKSYGAIVRSSCTAPGLWSVARAVASPSGNEAYWNNAC